MIQNKLKTNHKKTTGKKGFSLVEVLAASAVIISVSAVALKLGDNTKFKVKELAQRLQVVNFISDTFEAMDQSSGPLPLATHENPVTYCSACRSDLASCAETCSVEYTGQCPSDPEKANVQLDNIASNFSACYVIVKFERCDPEMDKGEIDEKKAGQFCGVGTVVQPNNDANGGISSKDYALTTFLFRN